MPTWWARTSSWWSGPIFGEVKSFAHRSNFGRNPVDHRTLAKIERFRRIWVQSRPNLDELIQF